MLCARWHSIPIDFVLVPKYLAMMVMMPCVTVMGVFSGILAGGVFSYFALDITLMMYLQRTVEILLMRDILSGLVKALVFGSIIVHVGCLEGFQVTGGPEGVGRSTTSAVVKSIFLVIIADLLCTAFLLFLLAMNEVTRPTTERRRPHEAGTEPLISVRGP